MKFLDKLRNAQDKVCGDYDRIESQSQLPALVDREIEELRLLQNEIHNSLSPTEINMLPEALRNNKFLDSWRYQRDTKRTTKNTKVATEQLQALAEYGSAWAAVLATDRLVLKEQYKTRLKEQLAKIEAQTEVYNKLAEQAEARTRYEEATGLKKPEKNENEVECKAVIAEYLPALKRINYDIETLYELAKDGYDPVKLEKRIEGALSRVDQKKQKTEPESEADRFRKKVNQYKNKYTVYAEIRKEYQNDPELAEKIIKELEADFKRERLNRQQ